MGFQIMGMDLACVFDALGQDSFPANDCLMPLLSKFLGYCIVITSVIVKVPQIYVIMKGKSVRGLSQSSFELEVVGYTIALAYCLYKRLPFSAYGELVFLLIQALILIALLYYYSRAPKSNVMSKTVLYCAVAPVLFAGRVDPALFEVLYASQHAIFFFSRLPQIYENFKNKNTGQLSFPTNFMGFGGCVVRLFTSIQESAPTSMIVGSILGFITNGVVVSQILLYGNKDGKRKEN